MEWTKGDKKGHRKFKQELNNYAEKHESERGSRIIFLLVKHREKGWMGNLEMLLSISLCVWSPIVCDVGKKQGCKEKERAGRH